MELVRIAGRYRLQGKIVSVSSHDVYQAHDIISGEDVVIKLERVEGKNCTLDHEFQIYTKLNGGPGIPHVRSFTAEAGFNAMAIDPLGLSLNDIFIRCHYQFSTKTVLLLAGQLLRRLQYIHSRNFVHRDLKPSSIVMGVGRQADIVHLIDFGLSKEFRDPNTHKHIPLNEGLGLTGSPTFASINGHSGLELGRRDDLESLAYILFYFLWGFLPWQGALEEQDILEGKRGITRHDLFHKLPVEFRMFLEHCRTLSFDGKPDYDHYYNIFDNLLVREGPQSDMAFDWVNAGREIHKQQNGSHFELDKFVLGRVLNEDPATHSVTLLGTLRPTDLDILSAVEAKPAIVRIERTALPSFSDGLIATTKVIGTTDIYAWMLGWLSHSEDRPDVKINVIYPATDVHIRKYSKQQVHIVRETPALYERIVKPYIDAFPTSRTQWIDEVISGRSEAEKVLFRSPPEADPFGFLILPDMKWDLVSLGSLYLVALTLLPNIKSLRDLDRSHLPFLRSVRREAVNVVKSRWGLEKTELRLFVHYQPSYYHFHVHIVNANHTALTGMTVGQAHMLDDIISLLELDEPAGPSIFQRMTLSYGLGEQHGLFSAMQAAQSELLEGEDDL